MDLVKLFKKIVPKSWTSNVYHAISFSTLPGWMHGQYNLNNAVDDTQLRTVEAWYESGVVFSAGGVEQN